MKVLIVSYMLPDSPSGVRYCYMQIAHNLKALGYTVDVITPASYKGILHYPLRMISWISRLLGKGAIYMGGEINNFVRLFIVLRKKTNTGYSIIHAHDIGSAYAATRAFHSKIPVVLTCHFNDDPASELIAQKKFGESLAARIRKWYGYQFSKVNYYTGVSNYVLDRAQRLFPQNALFKRIYNAIEFEDINGISPSIEFKKQFLNKKIIVNIGYLEKRKNQKYLIELAVHLKEVRNDFLIVIVGEGEDEQMLRSLILDNKLSDHVLLAGPYKNVFPILKCADLYIHTALNESFGKVILESIASEVPALAFPVGGIPEILHDPRSLIDPNKDKKEVAGYVNWLLEDSSTLEDIKNLQYSFALEHFHNDRMTEKYIEFYIEIIKDFNLRKDYLKKESYLETNLK